MKKNKPKTKTSKTPAPLIVEDNLSIHPESINQLANDQMTAAVGTRQTTGKPMTVFIVPNLERDKALDEEVKNIKRAEFEDLVLKLWRKEKSKTFLDKITAFFYS